MVSDIFSRRNYQTIFSPGNVYCDVKGQRKAKVKFHMNGELARETNEHTHPPSQDQTEVKKIKASIKQRSKATHDTPQQILGAAL